MGTQPLPDRLQRDALPVELAGLDEDPPDRRVVVPILRRIADPNQRAVGETHPPRTLDLEEEEGDRVVHPEHLQPLAGERAALDLAAIPVRPKASTAHHPGDLPSRQLPLEITEIDHLDVARREVERMDEGRLPAARAPQLGNVIAGQQPLALGVVGQGVERERLGEEGACRGVVSGRHRRRARAERSPSLGRANELRPHAAARFPS